MGPVAGDGRPSGLLAHYWPPSPGSRAPGPLAKRPQAPGPPGAAPAETGSAAGAHRGQSSMRLGEQVDGSMTFVAGPSQPLSGTRARTRQQTAYRGSRRDGRLVVVRGDGAAYRHVMSVRDSRNSGPTRPVDGGATADTDVDNGSGPTQRAGSTRSQPLEASRAPCGEQSQPDLRREPGQSTQRYPRGRSRRHR